MCFGEPPLGVGGYPADFIILRWFWQILNILRKNTIFFKNLREEAPQARKKQVLWRKTQGKWSFWSHIVPPKMFACGANRLSGSYDIMIRWNSCGKYKFSRPKNKTQWFRFERSVLYQTEPVIHECKPRRSQKPVCPMPEWAQKGGFVFCMDKPALWDSYNIFWHLYFREINDNDEHFIQ